MGSGRARGKQRQRDTERERELQPRQVTATVATVRPRSLLCQLLMCRPCFPTISHVYIALPTSDIYYPATLKRARCVDTFARVVFGQVLACHAVGQFQSFLRKLNVIDANGKR